MKDKYTSQMEQYCSRHDERYVGICPQCLQTATTPSHPLPVQEQGGKIETWVWASDRLPIHKGHWITQKSITHDNQFPVRMKGRYAMANIYDEAPKDSPSPKFMLKFEGKEHYEDQFSEIEWLDEYTSRTPPASQPSYVPETNVSLIDKGNNSPTKEGEEIPEEIIKWIWAAARKYEPIERNYKVRAYYDRGASDMYRHMQEERQYTEKVSFQVSKDNAKVIADWYKERERGDELEATLASMKVERDEALALLGEEKTKTGKLEQSIQQTLGWEAVKTALNKYPKTKD